MEKAELRKLVFQALRAQPQTQFDGVISRLRNLTTEYSNEDDLLVHEILWELLVQGVLAPGMNATNVYLPFIHVTGYGQRCLEAGELSPHDLDGYMHRLTAGLAGGVDPVLEKYVEESLSAFLAGKYFASAELLGVAAERLVDLLLAACAATLESPKAKEAFDSRVAQAGRHIARRFRVLREALLGLPLPTHRKDSIDVLLSGLFNLLRYSRDASGSPIAGQLDRESAHGNLLLFPGYTDQVHEILAQLMAMGKATAGLARPGAPAATGPLLSDTDSDRG